MAVATTTKLVASLFLSSGVLVMPAFAVDIRPDPWTRPKARCGPMVTAVSWPVTVQRNLAAHHDSRTPRDEVLIRYWATLRPTS